MATRLTILMQVTTDPTQRGDASPHSGGWSESFWARNPISAGDPSIATLLNLRSNMLPSQASIVGVRLANYNITGNRLVPTGSSTAKFQINGSTLRVTDVPQMALEMSGTAVGLANSSRFTCRCIPDDQVSRGEYQPTTAYKRNVQAYCQELVASNWKFLGRDLTRPSFNVLGIANNVVTMAAPLACVPGTDYLRFRRCYDDLSSPIKGAFLISAAAGNTVTLAGFPARTLTQPNGTVRIDAIALAAFATVTPNRIVVRKIGRPSESYRGRSSKRAA